jgi:hypothetical protein
MARRRRRGLGYDDVVDAADLAAERVAWTELDRLVDRLSPDERVEPGYLPGWSAKDVLGHIGTWQAEAAAALEQIRAGTYDPAEIDVDAMNARFLAAMRDMPFEVVHAQAWTARAQLLAAWRQLDTVGPNPDADAWLRKSGPEHYAEHLPRLRDWVAELEGARP